MSNAGVLNQLLSLMYKRSRNAKLHMTFPRNPRRSACFVFRQQILRVHYISIVHILDYGTQ